LALPVAPLEFFLDIEVDPMRDICYLHGVRERRGGDHASERFTALALRLTTLLGLGALVG
jgi:hypothetical protein